MMWRTLFCAVVAAPDGAEGAVDGLEDLVAVVHVAVGLGERRVAGVADGDEVFVALLLGDRQVAGGDGERVELAHGEVARGAAAVPVVELDQLDAQLGHDGARRDVVGLAGGFGRAAGVVEVLSLDLRLLGLEVGGDLVELVAAPDVLGKQRQAAGEEQLDADARRT